MALPALEGCILGSALTSRQNPPQEEAADYSGEHPYFLRRTPLASKTNSISGSVMAAISSAVLPPSSA